MAAYNLTFISDTDLLTHVKETVEKYRFTIDLNEFNKNIIDPIKLTFDTKVYDKNIRDVIEFEILRQLDKSNTNHIGYFHQNIFKYLGNGWHVPETGFDVVNDKQKIYVEMKNKHNTMNSSSSQKTYMRMQSVLIKEPTATCMLVEVIATKSQNAKWIVSLDGERVENENIRRVSIDQFYALVTGEQTAFKQLCEKLPTVIEDVIATIVQQNSVNTVFAELEQISPNLLKSLYLLAFKKYQGFENFNV
ncbi:MAG: Eco47II family restriction endonuclease [Methylococcales bacterium]|nr:Eco47II family restriction endonuclease [Methylococcales bacterium]